MLLAFSITAIATPTFPRVDEVLRVRRYARIDDHGHPQWRRRRGPIEGWTFPDGSVEHWNRWERGAVVETRRFNAASLPLTTVHYGEGPTSVTVHGRLDQTIDVSGWTTHELAGARIRVPHGPDRGAIDGGEYSVSSLGATDPFDETFAAGLSVACGCIVLDRTTTWLQGQPAARFQIYIPGTQPRAGEVWAIPRVGADILAVTWTSSVDSRVLSEGVDLATLAPGRAILALVELEGPE